MELERITIREGEGQYESLALALQAVAAAEGVELDYDDLCAALGLSFTAVSTQDAAPGWWMTYGRDAFAEPAARLFGIELRNLHPPDVGLDMAAAGEYPLHFDDSYKPLILRALENGQPVLAWQGWPEVRWPFWGVITGMVEGDLEGTTLWSGGERQRLVQPALQCYVVERCEPTPPGRRTLLQTAMRHADAYMNRAVYATASPRGTVPPLITGPAGFDAWERWFSSDDVASPAAGDSWNEHRQHAEFVSAARASAGRFLRRMVEVAEPEDREPVRAAADCCDALVSRLTDACDEHTVRELFASRQGRDKLLASVHAAEADDRRLAMQIERMAG